MPVSGGRLPNRKARDLGAAVEAVASVACSGVVLASVMWTASVPGVGAATASG